MNNRSCFQILLLIVLILPLVASAETQSGACGDNLTWTLDDNKVLTITGSGAMKNYGLKSNTSPWGKTVRQVKISQGVTNIGNSAFSGCCNLTSVTIPNSVTRIGSDVFDGCTNLMIYCYADSEAEHYAVANSINFEMLGDSPVPSISKEPTNLIVAEGGTATFTLTADNASSYQWYYRKPSSDAWLIIKENGTSATYNLVTMASHSGYQFRCLVKNDNGNVYSNTVSLIVTKKPIITMQPTNKTVNAGETASFIVTAENATAYQWYYRKTVSGDWISVKNNGTSACYNLTTIATHNGYQFRCLIIWN